MDKDDKLTRLETFNDEIQAALVVSALEAEGITARATGGFTAGFRAEAPGYVDVVVREADVDRARQILETIDLENETVDWSRVDVGKRENSD